MPFVICWVELSISPWARAMKGVVLAWAAAIADPLFLNLNTNEPIDHKKGMLDHDAEQLELEHSFNFCLS